jgi:hypothetical protein
VHTAAWRTVGTVCAGSDACRVAIPAQPSAPEALGAAVVRAAVPTSTWNVPIDVLISTRGASMVLERRVPVK